MTKTARVLAASATSRSIATRLMIERLPQVNPDGVYAAPGGGVADVMGGKIFPFAAAPAEAQCVYVDPAALKRYGLGDLLSPGPFPVDATFLRKLTGRFALRIDAVKDPSHATSLFASRYAQTEKNSGDGRGGYIVGQTPDGSSTTLFVKGLGQTPACNPAIAQPGHTDGYVSSHSSAAESTWPPLIRNLLTHTTPGTIAFFGLNVFGREFDGRIPDEEQAVILLRGGPMIRPAHVVGQTVYDAILQAAMADRNTYPSDWPGMPRRILGQAIQYEKIDDTVSPDDFFRAAHATGVLRYHQVPQHGDVPDLRATFLEIVDRFALTAAESWTHRIMQSAPSAGNAELSGGLIDVETASSNPRTGQMYVLSYSLPFGHPEFTWRAVAIKMMWDTLMHNLTAADQRLYNASSIDFAQAHASSYNRHLAVQYLRALGIKDEVVAILSEWHPGIVQDLSNALHNLATLENPNPIPYTMTREGVLLENAAQVVAAQSVVDVFGFLGRWPLIYFAGIARGQKPSLDAAIRALEPIYGAAGESGQSAQMAQVRQLSSDLVAAYDRVMQAALQDGTGHYDGIDDMQQDIAARAAFRHQPMDLVFYPTLRRDILDRVGQVDPKTGHTRMGDIEFLWPFVHSRVEPSYREIDALLRDRDVTVRGDGQVDVGVVMHGNTTYGVRADPVSGARAIFVNVPVAGDAEGPFELNLMGRGMSVPSIDGAKLLYRMTEAGAEVATGEAEAQTVMIGGYRYLGFTLPVDKSRYGVLHATLQIPGITELQLFEYAYVAPDNATVKALSTKKP